MIVPQVREENAFTEKKGDNMNNVKLISLTPLYMSVLSKAAGQCYQKKANEKTIGAIVNSGHLSVLEHCHATFELSCSISTLLQLTRHRHLSFTVQSSRGSELTETHKTGIEFLDDLIAGVMDDYEYCFKECRNAEDAAYLLPKAAKYKLVVTGSFRAWFEYLPKRLCKRAQKEHRELAKSIQEELAKAAPEIFKRDFMKCESCKERSCNFA